LRDNAEAFGRWRLRPRVLVDVSAVSAATTVLGTEVSMPVLVAPVAFQRLAHPDGEEGMARAAAAAGTVMCLSTIATATPGALAGRCELPIVVKGVLTAEDASLAVDHGASGIVVSNHGGRQLDPVAASLDALPEVVEAAAGRVEVLLDGGVRRGTDVITALAL